MKHEALIDTVACDMTDADPSAGFRARVITSLPPQRRSWWLGAVIPAGAVAVLALAVWASMPGTTGTRRVLSPVSEQAAHRSDLIAPVVPAAPLVPVVSEVPVVPVAPADDPAWHARAIAALPPAPPITFTSIQPIPISIAPITMEPIVFEPIAVPAIDPRSGGRQ